MNSGFQHKILNYEVQPPAFCWEKIQEELDSSALQHHFPKKLQAVEIAPPAYCWNNIAATLDGKGAEAAVAAKLQKASVVPPAAVWQNIEAALDQETNQPAQKRSASLLRYAAAAALIGLLAWGAAKLLNNKGEDTPLATQPKPGNNTEQVTTEHTSIPEEDIAAISAEAALEEARNDAALEASKKTVARLDVSAVQKKIKDVSAFDFGVSAEDDTVDASTNRLNDISNRYIVLMTPDGHFIRMSKKLKDLVCCISGEEVDAACLDQLKRWREKILSSSAVHAPGNFADILNLVTSMQDNNQ